MAELRNKWSTTISNKSGRLKPKYDNSTLNKINQPIAFCGLLSFSFPSCLPALQLASTAQAVVPAPDGGYPGFTTAEGQNALKNLTTGSGNTAVGWYSLFSDTTGSFNTGVGAGTLLENTANENTATGTGALLSNTTGGLNTANGAFALLSNTEGSSQYCRW